MGKLDLFVKSCNAGVTRKSGKELFPFRSYAERPNCLRKELFLKTVHLISLCGENISIFLVNDFS